jgi:hypothetical protein
MFILKVDLRFNSVAHSREPEDETKSRRKEKE